jgi:putative zinc finger/helix-turn-helix YgiT family protein
VRFRRGTRIEKLVVEGRTFTAEVNTKRCSKCDEALVALEELALFEVAVAAELARSGARSGEAIRFMRRAIGLRASDLASLLDVAPETLSRWETGEREAPRAYVAVVGGIVLDQVAGCTITADRLRALRGDGPELPKVVRIGG